MNTTNKNNKSIIMLISILIFTILIWSFFLYKSNKNNNLNPQSTAPQNIKKQEKYVKPSKISRKENNIKYTDRVKVVYNNKIDITPVQRAKPSKNIDIKYWKEQVLPFSEDRNYDQYIVIPKLGIITPLIYYTFTGDIETFDQKQLNKAFASGVALYPQTAKLGQYGNAIIGGHSSYFKSLPSNYKTIFTTLPELDPGDEVRWYSMNPNTKKRTRYRYKITQSFAMKEFTQDIIAVHKWVKEMTLYTCIPIGTDKNRWIVKAKIVEKWWDLESILKDKIDLE